MSRAFGARTRWILISRDDVKHGLKELASLDLVTESGKKGIDVSWIFYKDCGHGAQLTV